MRKVIALGLVAVTLGGCDNLPFLGGPASPHRKAGLWEQTTQSDRSPTPLVSEACYDQASDLRMPVLPRKPRPGGRRQCETFQITKNGDSYVIELGLQRRRTGRAQADQPRDPRRRFQRQVHGHQQHRCRELARPGAQRGAQVYRHRGLQGRLPGRHRPGPGEAADRRGRGHGAAAQPLRRRPRRRPGRRERTGRERARRQRGGKRELDRRPIVGGAPKAVRPPWRRPRRRRCTATPGPASRRAPRAPPAASPGFARPTRRSDDPARRRRR